MSSRNIPLGLKSSRSKIASTTSLSPTVPRSVLKSSGRSFVSLGKRKEKEETPSIQPALQVKKQKGSTDGKSLRAMRSGHSLHVGVDFGTTYSGIAFVGTIEERGEVIVLNEYSGGQLQSDILEKVPTRIAYPEQNNGKGAWGYNVKPGMVCCSWFKLMLDKDTDLKEHDDPTLKQSAGIGMFELPPGKDEKDVTADFLRYLYEHVMLKLGEYLTDSMLELTSIQFHFTVPADWSPKARNLTREAAEIAGFGSRTEDELCMIDEPEAAAIDAIRSTIEKFPEKNPFKSGQGIMIVDIGGGTGDLVSYKIDSESPLELEEICIGVGAKCGGTSADRALHALLTVRYGAAFTNQPLTKIGPGSKFMNSWEGLKRDYNGGDMDAQFELHLKMNGLDDDAEAYDFDTDEILLTAFDLVDIFKVVVNSSIGLVREQLALIQKRRKSFIIHKLILVGGMGSSPYLINRFKNLCEDELEGKITLVQPLRPWSAVCRGAARRGLETNPVLTRQSRCNYGYMLHMDFEEGKHLEEDAFEDEVNGKRAKEQMIWPTRKNESLKPGQKKVTVCCYTIPPYMTKFTPRIVLYCCAENVPPTRKDNTVSKVGTIKTDLTKHVQSERKRLIVRGDISEDDSFELIVRLHLKLGSEKGILEAHATSNGKNIGETRIDYEGNTHWERDGAQGFKAEV